MTESHITETIWIKRWDVCDNVVSCDVFFPDVELENKNKFEQLIDFLASLFKAGHVNHISQSYHVHIRGIKIRFLYDVEFAEEIDKIQEILPNCKF